MKCPVLLATFLTASLAAGCTSHPPTPAGHPNTTAKTQAKTQAARPPQPPPSPDVSQQVMGWIVLESGAHLARTVALTLGVDPGMSPEQVFGPLLADLLGLDPRLLGIVDFTRPAAVALLNPSLLKGAAAQPLLLLLPVHARSTIEKVLTQAGIHFAPTDWGMVIRARRGPMFLSFKEGYAQIAWRPELVNAAATILTGPLGQARGLLRMHVSVDNVRTWYGPQMKGVLAGVSQGMDDPQWRFTRRNARRFARFITSLKTVDLRIGNDERGLGITVRAAGRSEPGQGPGEGWLGHLASQPTGPVWGTEFIPPDAVLVYSSHRHPATAHSDLEDAINYIGDVASPPVPLKRRATWRRPLDRAADQMSGELIYAVWPGQGNGGGLGLGGAFGVHDTAAARRDMLTAYQMAGKELAALAVRALDLDTKHLRVRSAVHRDATRIADTPVDTFEISVDWPRRARVERKRFETLLGGRLVLGLAFVNDAALFTMGRDWQARLGAMIQAAQGTPAPSLAEDPGFTRAIAYRSQDRVSLTYLPLGRMSRFLELPPQFGAAGATQGNDVIVFTTNTSGTGYEINTHVPHTALPGLLRSSGALWRVALTPLVNPPVLPPLPGTLYPLSIH